ncbi:MAG: glycosyltransferase [Bacteroidetes bacterium]|nr:MAG: glycosyltransferase [Bacteroidota bacterium]
MWVLSSLGIILFFLYARLFLSYMKGWKETKLSVPVQQPEFASFSILVPFRNEAQSLPRLFQCFENLDSDGITVELILIDDHSEDRSFQLAKAWSEQQPWARCVQSKGIAKKAAIQTGIELAQNEFILCTDSDVQFGSGWLRAFAEQANETTQLISGPVQLEGKGGFFHRWQELEFSGLIAIGAASIQMNRPNMCNGANLAYRKSAFHQVNGFEDNAHLMSGDDEFLMHKIYATYGRQAVHFLKDKRALVYTETKDSLTAFLSQRSRWSSKATQYKDKRVTLDLFIAYFAACFALSGILILPFSLYWAIPGLLFLAGKSFLEFVFFGQILSFFAQEKQRKYFFVSELFQVVYVVVIGVLGTFVKFEWKGRKQ